MDYFTTSVWIAITIVSIIILVIGYQKTVEKRNERLKDFKATHKRKDIR